MKNGWMASLCMAAGAFLLSGGLLAQDLVSLDEWVKAQNLTPVIDGGTPGTQSANTCPAVNAFDGIVYSDDYSDRWLGSIQNGCYLLYALPDELSTQFEVKGYRLHTLSTSTSMYERAPRSWALYGHADASAAADDAGWVLIDSQSDVVWPFDTGDYDTSVPSTKFVTEFSLSEPVIFRAYKWVPLSSNQPTTDTWTTGLMELVFLGNESASGYVVVQGAPSALGEVSPSYGTHANLAVGSEMSFTASAYTYTDTIRYRCAGYVLETLDADGNWVVNSTNLEATAYAYTGDGNGTRLTWLWEEDGYKLAAGLEFGGTESVSASPVPDADGYYAADTAVTLTPVVPEGTSSTFRFWYGDVPATGVASSPLVLTMDQPRTVYAFFRRTWSVVDGTQYQITDGNWTLRLSVANDNTCGVGIDAAYQAIVEGSGILDLTAVADDTGLLLTRVEPCAFKENTAIAGILLPETVTTIGNEAFRGCTSLRGVQLPSKLETLGNYAFSRCSALQGMIPFLPETVRTIGFYG